MGTDQRTDEKWQKESKSGREKPVRNTKQKMSDSAQLSPDCAKTFQAVWRWSKQTGSIKAEGSCAW